MIALKGPDNETQLCAYLVGREFDKNELRDLLAEWLPVYMIPADFVQLASMPLNPSGKVDRKALPEPEWTGDTVYVAPRNEVETRLVDLWAEVLHVDAQNIGIDENFLDLGGHSIKASVLVANIHKRFDVKLPLAEVFEKPTIRAMAQFVGSQQREENIPLEPVGEDFCRLSSAQNRLYIMQQMDERNTVYNVPGFLVLRGTVEPDRIETAFQTLIDRHASLRTSFAWNGDRPLQYVSKQVSFKLETPEGGPFTEMELVNSFVRPFDLSKAPLIRVGLAPLGEERHFLMVDMHHIVSDGLSLAILIREFVRLYGGEELEPLKYQYMDFAHWQNRLFQSRAFSKQKEYWLDIFNDGVPVLELPTDFKRPEQRNYSGAVVSSTLENDLVRGIHRLTRQADTTPFIVLLTVFNILIWKFCRQEDLVVGSPVTGRTHADIQDIVGMFVNMLSIRNRMNSKQSFLAFLSEVKVNAIRAFDNQDYQFDELVRELGIVRETNRNPLFNVVFQLDNLGINSLSFGGLDVQLFEVEEESCQFDLILAALSEDDCIKLNLTYSTELFKPSTAEKLFRWLEEILSQVIVRPEMILEDINVSHGGLLSDSYMENLKENDFGF